MLKAPPSKFKVIKEKRKKKKVHKPESVSVPLEKFDNTFKITGVIKIVLSTMTQKAIGCVVGEDITSDDPWILIKKEKIEDNIELHEESSEFLPIKKKIFEYPEEEILLGFDKPIEDDKLEFFLCSTKAAKEEVQVILKKQKDELEERLKQSIFKCPGKWKTYGSESEVDELMIKNFRPLLEIEVNSNFPIWSDKKKFKLRLAEDSKDGYVELLPGRFPTENVYRKRLEVGIQAAPSTRNNDAQTNPTFPRNKGTQYEYEYKEPKLDKFQSKSLIKFVTEHADKLSETIHVNEHINLYIDDYMKIHKDVVGGMVETNRDIISFRHVIACKSKVVADVTLDPFHSGILAAAYGKWSFHHFRTVSVYNDIGDEVNEQTFGQNLVLIWCNTNPLNPKLYLRSPREVSKVRHCASIPEILLGGCTNGQIIIWDLRGRLKNVETMDISTPREQKHRSIMQSLMTWMKNTQDVSVVLPTVISNPDFSHNNIVTELRWLVTDHKVSRNGKVTKNLENEESLQFMTASLDGSILIWDLLNQPDLETKKSKKSTLLGKRPSALLSNVSEFRYLHLKLTPLYKLNVLDKITHKPLPITCMNIRNENFKYKARNPETANNYLQRTYFDRVPADANYKFDSHIQVTDMLGHFLSGYFEGQDYDQGQKINFENIEYVKYQTVHDGPIRVCLNNRHDPNIILTLGGRIFAIWHIKKFTRPMIWRKIPCKYVGGVWSSQRLGAVVLQREDSYVETWNLLEKTKGPVRIVRMSGNAATDYFSDYRRKHVKKLTICTSDVFGAVRIYKIPPARLASSLQSQFELADIIIERIRERRDMLKNWIEDWNAKHLKVEPVDETLEKPKEEQAPPKEVPEPEPEPEPEETDKKKKVIIKTGKQKLEEREGKFMYNVLLQQKKLNLDEIEKHKIPLQEMIAAQKQKTIRKEETLARKEEIFAAAKKKIFTETLVKESTKYEIDLPIDVQEEIKKKYCDKYYSVIDKTLDHIRGHGYDYKFKWESMLAEGKARRKIMSLAPPIEERKSRKSSNPTEGDSLEEKTED